MELLPAVPHHRVLRAGLGLAASAVLHAALVLAAARHPLELRLADAGDILPALYIYAPDRRPETPRELRMPIPVPPGEEFGGLAVAEEGQMGLARARPPQPPRGLPALGPLTPRLDSVYSVFAVDAPVERDPTSAGPEYPVRLLELGVEGFVDTEFVVDTTGRVDLLSLRITRSTHPDFSAAVEAALAGARYRPAWRGPRKVRQLVTQRFSFRIAPLMAASESVVM